MDDLSRAPCLRAAALETIRRFPFFPGVACTATREFAFEGRRVPAGRYLLVCTPATNFLPEFFPDPFAFRWQRFLATPPPRMPSWTFGGGPHACPARSVVPSLLVFMAARLLDRFEFELAFRDVRYQPRPYMPLRGRPIRARGAARASPARHD